MSDLKLAVSKGTIWSGAGSALSAVIHLIVLTVLARKLDPTSFGIFSLAFIIIQLFAEVGELGIQAGLIRSKLLEPVQIYSCFWVNLGALTILALVLFFMAPLSRLLIKGDVVMIFRALSLILIFEGLAGVPSALLIRKLSFMNISIIEVMSNLTYGIVAIICAYRQLGVWSLVIGAIFQRMIKTTLLFIAARFLPNFTLNIKAIKEILIFGINLAGERIVNFFAQRADYLLIGKYLGSAALGFYSMAAEISTLPQNKFSSIIARVTYPAYSKIQEDNARLGRAYLKVISLVSSITFPILFLIGSISKKFIVLFLGDKWLPAVPILQLLCLLGSLKSVGYLVGSLLNAKGRSDIGFKWSFVMLAGTLVGVTIGMHWGLMGAALGYCISFVILLPIIQTIALRLIGLRLTAYIKALFPALASAFIMSVGLWYFGAGIIKGSTAEKYVSFFLALFLGASMYFVGIYILNKKNIEELWQIGKMIFREVK